jgi:hypothetical protein
MTSNRRKLLPLLLAAIAMQSCSTFAGPQMGGCDLIQQSRAQTPVPLVPTPSPEAPELLDTPAVIVPAEPVPLGEPIAIGLDFTPAAGSRVKVTWEHGQYATREFAAERFYVWAKAGAYTGQVRVIEVPKDADAEIGDWVLPFEFTVGDPPPPKPMVELVTPDQAPLLADCYLRLSTLADSFTSEAHFWANADALLNAKGVLGHGATEAVKARLTPWDKATLAATLATISKEFGEPVKPDDPPVTPDQPTTPGTPVSFDGFHAIFLREDQNPSLWFGQLMADRGLQEYLSTHCAGGPAGWRQWDDDVPLANVPANFRELMNLPRASVPCVVVAANKGAVVLPLSETTTAAGLIETLKQFGGP